MRAPTPNTAKKFEEFVKWKRQRNGWSQLELAVKAFGPTSSHNLITKIEKGGSITTTTMDKLLFGSWI